MTKRTALVVSHADADGHIIAEQVRRNLSVIGSLAVTTLVDPSRTSDHRTWLRLDAIASEVDQSDLIFFVDLMFAPTSFGAEADALVRFARSRPDKRFFLLDHHPVPMRRLGAADNVRAFYRQDVVDCTFGPPSPMMIVAALCEKQPTAASRVKEPIHDVLAQGVRRAAALGGPLPGQKLAALLRHDRWDAIEELGREDRAEHQLPRGRRRRDVPLSPALRRLDALATDLLKSRKKPPQHHLGDGLMSYDLDVVDRTPPKISSPPPNRRDLEAIVMLMELAALSLTTEPGVSFSVEQLVREAREIGGPDVDLDDADIAIVLEKAAFLKKEKKKLSLK